MSRSPCCARTGAPEAASSGWWHTTVVGVVGEAVAVVADVGYFGSWNDCRWRRKTLESLRIPWDLRPSTEENVLRTQFLTLIRISLKKGFFLTFPKADANSDRGEEETEGGDDDEEHRLNPDAAEHGAQVSVAAVASVAVMRRIAIALGQSLRRVPKYGTQLNNDKPTTRRI